MKYRALSADQDHTFGQNQWLSNKEAIAQAIYTRLRLLRGEWWENLDDGLPLWGDILSLYGGEAGRQAVDLLIMERIQGTAHVQRVTSFKSEFMPATREYSVVCSVLTDLGEVEINEIF